MSEGNGFATRDTFLTPRPRQYKEVTVEGFGKVNIRSLTEYERAQMEAPNYTRKGTINIEKMGDSRCRLIVAAVCDGAGNPILTNGDIAQLRQQDSAVVNQLADEIAKHCGISQADLEELEKKAETPAGK